MRGFPPLHLILFSLAFLVSAVPLARLTFARPQVTASVAEEELDLGKPVNVFVQVKYAHAPSQLTIHLGDQVLLAAETTDPAVASIESTQKFLVPKEGIELLVEATWPDNTPDTALTVELVPDGFEPRSQTHWASGASLSEIFLFTW